jgi:hypothetical protein
MKTKWIILSVFLVSGFLSCNRVETEQAREYHGYTEAELFEIMDTRYNSLTKEQKRMQYEINGLIFDYSEVENEQWVCYLGRDDVLKAGFPETLYPRIMACFHNENAAIMGDSILKPGMLILLPVLKQMRREQAKIEKVKN